MLLNRSVMTSMYAHLRFDFESRPRMSMATNSSGPEERNSVSVVLCFPRVHRFAAQERQSINVCKASFVK